MAGPQVAVLSNDARDLAGNGLFTSDVKIRDVKVQVVVPAPKTTGAAMKSPSPQILEGLVVLEGFRVAYNAQGQHGWNVASPNTLATHFEVRQIDFRGLPDDRGARNVPVDVPEHIRIPLRDGKIDFSAPATKQLLGKAIGAAWPEAARQQLKLIPLNETTKELSQLDLRGVDFQTLVKLTGAPVDGAVGEGGSMVPRKPGSNSVA